LLCIVCSSNNLYILNEFDNYNTVRCGSCGALFTDKVFDSKTHYTKWPHPKGRFRILASIPRKVTAKFYFNYLKEHIDLTKIKSVLDIGADQGHFIKLFEDKGIKTLGIEPIKINVESSVAKNLEYGFFDENYTVNETFDLVCLAQIMYYFRDNYRILKKVVSMLNPGGYIFISTANPDSERVVEHYGKKGTPYNAACVLARKNWIEMVEKIGCGLVDYSFWEPSIMLDIYFRRFKSMKYLLFPSSGYRRAGEDGYWIMLLLRKTVS
jgi:2-polyprenyl-3-methyl-5-hydroxy-6-metoxy-1,4-benzoquinol methylase